MGRYSSFLAPWWENSEQCVLPSALPRSTEPQVPAVETCSKHISISHRPFLSSLPCPLPVLPAATSQANYILDLPAPWGGRFRAGGNQILRESLQHAAPEGWVKRSTISLAGSIAGQLWPTCEINCGVPLFRCAILLLQPPHLQALAQAKISLDFANFVAHL